MYPAGQHRYARFIERTDRRKKSGFPPDLEFRAHSAYRAERRKLDPRLQVSKEDIDTWTAGVFEASQADKAAQKRWITAHYNTDSSNRVRLRRALLDEFNRAALGSDPKELTDEASRLIAARVLLQPGELSLNEAEVSFVKFMWARWCSTKKSTQEWVMQELKNHYFPEDEKRKKGRKRVDRDPDDGSNGDESSLTPKRTKKKSTAPEKSRDAAPSEEGEEGEEDGDDGDDDEDGSQEAEDVSPNHHAKMQ